MNNTEKVFDIMNEFNESLFGNDSNLTMKIPEQEDMKITVMEKNAISKK